MLGEGLEGFGYEVGIARESMRIHSPVPGAVP